MHDSLTFTREGAVITATPVLEGSPVLAGDELFVNDMENALNTPCTDPWFPPNEEDTPVFNLCAAALVCGADRVGENADTDAPFPFQCP